MKSVTVVLFCLFLYGCNKQDNSAALIDKCQQIYKEECMLVPIPKSEKEDMEYMYRRWATERLDYHAT